MSEWQDMQQKLNIKLQDLLKNKKAETISNVSFLELNKMGWKSLMGCLTT
jgi:hypothetical protein